MCSSMPGKGRRGRPLAMHSALAPTRHQPRSLQRLLHPAVAELDLVLAAQLLLEVPHVQIVIALAVQPHHLLHQSQRTRFGEGCPRRRSNNPS